MEQTPWFVDFVNDILVFLSVAAFGAGRILGLDQYIEQYEIGGQLLVERYPWTRYFLG